MRSSLQDRFWKKVIKTDSCWTGSKNKLGYGRLQRGKRGEGIVKAHRLSYELHYGPFPQELIICHKCDNPECTNPAHLFLGTKKDNSKDMINKKRGQWTSENNRWTRAKV